MKTTKEKVAKLESDLRDSNIRLQNSKSEDAKFFHQKAIDLIAANLAVVKARAEYEKVESFGKLAKKQARDEKRKTNALLIFHKREQKLKDYAQKTFGVDLKIETVGTNHLPAVPVKS